MTPGQLRECLSSLEAEERAGRRLLLGQLLVRRRLISCAAYIEIERALGHTRYACEACGTRYASADVERGDLVCRVCKTAVIFDARDFSAAEILAVNDPRELALPLRPVPARTKTAAAPTRITRAVLEVSREELSGLARYEVLDELGRGGMGVVFKARHVDMDRVCALKVIKASPQVPEIQLKRFVQEARSVAQLRHPGIATVYDFGQHRDVFYIAMEFIEGRSLFALIHHQELPHDRAIEIAKDVLDALEYAHSRGVIHRDVKPQNVLVEESTGRGRLIDFGLAKDTASSDLELTQPGQILGSPFYLSPEQTRGESYAVDARSDVFAMGTVLYEMLTRRRPFDGKSAAEVYGQILHGRPPRPSQVVGGIAPGLDAVVLKALEKDPDRRFRSGAELRSALAAPRSARKESAPGRTSSGRARPARALDAVSTGPPPSSMAAILAAAAAGLVLAVLAGSRSTPEPASVPAAQGSSAPGSSEGSSREAARTPDPASSDGEAAALRVARAAEESSPDDWGELMRRWKEVERLASRRELARARLGLLRSKAEAEAASVAKQADDLSAEWKYGAARDAVLAVAPRFAGTEWAEKLSRRARRAETDAVAAARSACEASNEKLAQGDYLGAMVPLTMFTRTGIGEADELLKAQRAVVVEAAKKGRSQE